MGFGRLGKGFGKLGAPTGGGSVAAPTYATWNPSDKGSGITLSNGNLTATHTVDTELWMARATVGKAAGKWYWEITVVSQANDGQNLQIGVADLTRNISGQVVFGNGANEYSVQMNTSGGAGIRETGVAVTDFTGDIPNAANGNVWGIALDMDNDRIYIHKNGTYINSGDPAAGTGFLAHDFSGTWYPAIGFFQGIPGSMTANFGATAFTHSVPSGYTSGVTA